MYCFSRAPEDEWRVAIHRHCPMSPFFKIGESSGKGTWRICWCSEVAVIGQVFAFQQKSRLPAWILQNELHPVSSRAQREYLWEYFREILSTYNVHRTRDFVQPTVIVGVELMDSFHREKSYFSLYQSFAIS